MSIASGGDGAVAPRVLLLDGLRGVAVLMVLGFHAGWEITYGLTLETGVTTTRDLATAFGEIGHLWSLSVEEQFYPVWPRVVLLVPTDKLLRVSLGLVVASAVFRGFAHAMISEEFAYYFTLCRLDGLALGAVGAAAFDDPGLRGRIRPAVQWVGRFWWIVPLLLLVPRGLIAYGGGLLLITGYLGLILAADMGTLAARPSRTANAETSSGGTTRPLSRCARRSS